MNNVGNEVSGKVEVGDGDGVMFGALLADAVDDNARLMLNVCRRSMEGDSGMRKRSSPGDESSGGWQRNT